MTPTQAYYLPYRRSAFSYVGACQVLMGVYIYFSHGLSRLVHSAAVILPQGRK